MLLGLNPGRDKRFLFSTKKSIPTARPTQPFIQWTSGFFPEGKAAEEGGVGHDVYITSTQY